MTKHDKENEQQFKEEKNSSEIPSSDSQESEEIKFDNFDGPKEIEATETTVPLSKYQRLQADFENYKRRSRQEMTNMTCLGREQVIEELLGVVDNFSRALKVDHSHSGVEELKKGMELIYRQFGEVLNKHGLESIEAEGFPFDPEFHQAIMKIDTDDEDQDDMVLEDLQKGYTINGKVIRPSMVKVGKYCKNEEEK